MNDLNGIFNREFNRVRQDFLEGKFTADRAVVFLVDLGVDDLEAHHIVQSWGCQRTHRAGLTKNVVEARKLNGTPFNA